MQRWGDSLEAGCAGISDGAYNGGGSIRQDPWAPALGVDWMAMGQAATGQDLQEKDQDMTRDICISLHSLYKYAIMQCASLCPESLIYNNRTKQKTKRRGLTAAVELMEPRMTLNSGSSSLPGMLGLQTWATRPMFCSSRNQAQKMTPAGQSFYQLNHSPPAVNSLTCNYS